MDAGNGDQTAVRQLADSEVTAKIMEHIKEKGPSFLREISRHLTEQGATRKQAYSKLCDLEGDGVLDTAMVEVTENEESVRTWVKQYSLAERLQRTE